ncbi:hypothetical protein FWF74_03670 [Candidatus Saccharibacteria bacterium]|nr:hypothetical protein [Candidatus Saccharibacteria bacterium]MCL1962873.1 hypothetical protein [Candidatus Saccharibacteria bacterium]
MKKVTILGAGAYSIALSRILNGNGVDVTLYTKFTEEKELLERERGNEKLLPGVKLGDKTDVSDNIAVVDDSELIVSCVPSDATRSVIGDLKPHYNGQVICIATKGVEKETGYFMDQIITDELPDAKVCALSGPSFAAEIARFLPTAVTVAGPKELTGIVSSYFSNDKFEIEETTDVRGALICGAFNNILAVGAGILVAENAGDNALATLTVNGLHEIGIICKDSGGENATAYMSCGLGEAAMKCVGSMSRNKRFGMLIGEGHPLDAVLADCGTVEGYRALKGAKKLIVADNLKAPVISTICDIVLDGANPDLLITAICK